MKSNWSVTTSQLDQAHLGSIQKKMAMQIEADILKMRPLSPSIFDCCENIEWLKPQEPNSEDFEKFKFLTLTDRSMKMGVPSHALFGCDVGDVDATFVAYEAVKPKNKWLRVAALSAAVILFVAIWSQR